MSIKIVQLDPRNTSEAQAHNDAIFNSGPVLGVEVTDPPLAARCSLGNIDHHGDQAAIDVALRYNFESLSKNFTIAILKPDCDTIAATAIMHTERYKENSGCPPPNWIKGRISLISKLDRFAKDPVWHPHDLPTKENPWLDNGGVESSKELAPLQAMCSDFSLSLETRLDGMTAWLRGIEIEEFFSKYPKNYTLQVEKERQSLIASLESGKTKMLNGCYMFNKCPSLGQPCMFCLNRDTAPDLPIIIESSHRGATMVAYCLGSVGIAHNPQFQPDPSKEPYDKYTVFCWDQVYADIPAAIAELAALESGWSSHQPTIGGSPQDRSTELSMDTIVEVVQRHLKGTNYR